jgi:hypothetical protein
MTTARAPARREPGTAPGARPRILLTLVLIAAAMPVRLASSVPGINSVSVLDILLGAVAITLVVDLAFRPLDVGYPELFALLCVPVVVCGMSMLWTQDRGATFRATVVYAEGIVA